MNFKTGFGTDSSGILNSWLVNIIDHHWCQFESRRSDNRQLLPCLTLLTTADAGHLGNGAENRPNDPLQMVCIYSTNNVQEMFKSLG